MNDALEDHTSKVSIGGKPITYLCFADNIDGLAGKEEELIKLVSHLDKASMRYGMAINVQKTN